MILIINIVRKDIGYIVVCFFLIFCIVLWYFIIVNEKSFYICYIYDI